ncbi:DUF4105 domain-containing protein [Flavobacterium sp. MFBS3-15]|uniref:Lnb N-terminal periplasmic domain-containing protein n=1 Tax=Flavobacterium sp. MFBS3-15 TaxID=2989816 RepID=UPI0022365CC1|nr:DUF4105 domain-containing protein [Flavobacterium sp. MFBS3-15]MCW4469591.1 DUF4105 domain-containing protein [Flavobacterium sp. MFBS3-15]
MRLKVLLLFIIIYLSLSNTSVAKITLSQDSKVTLLTCGPGDELYSVFGHTALRVNDPASGRDIVYNFGTFDFDTPNFYLKFVKGDLQYKLSTSSYEDFIYTYQYFNRDVFEQELNLTLRQKENILNELERILGSEERLYTYKFIDRNCTTRVADLIEQYASVKIPMENVDKGKTKRSIIIERLQNNFYESLGINLLFGYKTDEKLQRLFLPDHLMDGISTVSTQNGKIAKPVVTVYKSTAENRKSAWNNFYTYAAACLILMIGTRNKIVLRTWLAITGLLGIMFCFMGLYSLHTELQQNYNVLLFNPLFLLLLVFIYSGKRKAIMITSSTCLFCCLIYLVFLINKPHFVMMLPLIAVNAVVLLRLIYTKFKK